jgi:hypothetical protein
MKTSTSIFKNSFTLLIWVYAGTISLAQSDTGEFIHRISVDTSSPALNMDAVYNRPFLTAGKLPVAIGGYMEANTQYGSVDGVSEGISFQARRFTLFFSSTIASNIKFLSEIEFEDGSKEINIEFAAMDIEILPLLNFRGGIIMNPIGAYNQNHDGPHWDFIDRPLSATGIIPSTLSNAGFGLHGKYYVSNWILGYEVYLTNGFNDEIISNSSDRTSLAAGKVNPERFEENFSGLPMYTGKLAIRNRRIGEMGLSYMSGIYNKWKEDGLILDLKRSVSVIAVDFNSSFFRQRVSLKGEFAQLFIDIPGTYTQQYGSRQSGGYLDIVWTVLQGQFMGWENSKLNVGVRLEYVDYNQGSFEETGSNIGDEIMAIVPGIAFRPAGTTVLRFNYRLERHTDLFLNPHSNTGVIQFGVSTYF